MIGTATAGDDGSWTAEVRIPSDIEIGEHSIQVEGTAPGDVDRTIRATLRVADPTSVLTLPEPGSDLTFLNYSILIGALGALFAMVATGSRRRSFTADSFKF